MNNNQELFITNIIEFEKTLYNMLDSKLNKFYKIEKVNRAAVYNIVSKVMLDNNIKDTILVLNKVQQAHLYNTLNDQVKELMKSEFIEEKKVMEQLLKDMTLDMYNYNQYLYSIGIDYTLKVVSDKELKRIINTKIKSELWSDRLWENKKSLNELLQNKIYKFLNGEINVNDIKSEIKELYNRSAYETKRLVNTETSKVLEEVNEVFAKDNGEWQLFMATLDKRTSNLCRNNDGKVFKINDNNKPITPLHPFCRSTLVLIPNENWKPKQRKNNETKDLADYKTYKEWELEQGLV